MDISRYLFLGSRLLCSPLEAFIALLIFILSKNLNATPLQLTLVACLKPITSLFAFYTSSFLFNKSHRIRKYLIIVNLSGCLPCFLFPFIEKVWFYIASYAIYMVVMRASYPAWIEILKGRLDLKAMSTTISRGTSIYYFSTIAIPLLFSPWMDNDKDIWKYIFFFLAAIQFLNTFLILLVPKNTKVPIERSLPTPASIFIDPWKKGWRLLRENPSFTHYQALFFIGGVGIIATQPILPIYFKENLHLSYTQLTLAFSFCKGIAFIFTSPIWAKYVNKASLYAVNCYMNLFTSLFFAFILVSTLDTSWLYVAYLFYGTMQSGCELSWNLSGPVFSDKKESTIYSSLNLAVIGVRGCICPFLGHLLFVSTDASCAFVIAFAISFMGIFYGIWLDARYKFRPTVA